MIPYCSAQLVSFLNWVSWLFFVWYKLSKLKNTWSAKRTQTTYVTQFVYIIFLNKSTLARATTIQISLLKRMLKTQKQETATTLRPNNQYRQTITTRRRITQQRQRDDNEFWRVERVLLCACMSVFSLCCVSIGELAPLCVGQQQLRTGEHRKTKVLAPKFWRFTWSWISQTSGQSAGSKTASHRSPNTIKKKITTENKQIQDGQCTRSQSRAQWVLQDERQSGRES